MECHWLILQSMASSDQSDGPITLEEYLEVKKALVVSQAHVQQLIQTNKDLKQEISLLQNMVSRSDIFTDISSDIFILWQVNDPDMNFPILQTVTDI